MHNRIIQENPVFYKTVVNAIESKKMGHCYLLFGDIGSPLKECAMFFAKSIICESGVACNKCPSCIQIDEGVYPDFTFIDGTQMIKKEEIQNLLSSFSKGAITAGGKRVFIIHLVDRMSAQASNSLLKFLEEPDKDVYGILTSESRESVLKTIISRSQNLRIKTPNKNEVVSYLIAKGIEEKYALILAAISGSSIEAEINYQNETFLFLIKSIPELFSQFEKEEVLFYCQNKITPIIKNKEDARLFFNLLEIFFKDVMYYKYNEPLRYFKQEEGLIVQLSSKISDINGIIKEIILIKKDIEHNCIINLLLDKVLLMIMR